MLALEEGRLLSNMEMTQLVRELVRFTSEATISAGDLQVGGRLLGQLVGLAEDAETVQVSSGWSVCGGRWSMESETFDLWA